MNAQQLTNYLKEKYACQTAIEWQKGKDLQTAWETCERADWMMWLFTTTNLCDKRLITKVAGLLAQTVEHLREDQRSKVAADFAVSTAAAGSVVYTTYYAADAAACADDTDEAFARKEQHLKMCDIIRQHIPLETLTIYQTNQQEIEG